MENYPFTEFNFKKKIQKTASFLYLFFGGKHDKHYGQNLILTILKPVLAGFLLFFRTQNLKILTDVVFADL